MFINNHTHTGEGSNYRLLDSTIRIGALFNYTRELGHKGVAITEHETVGSHIAAIKTLEELKNKEPEKWKDYKLILGNEIYLCNRKAIQEDKQYNFYHFILLAKNAKGHHQIRELSTRAWIDNSFMWVMMRVPTFYDDLKDVVGKEPGNVIGSTACIGGAAPQAILKAYNENPKNPDYSKVILWLRMMNNLFGQGNFYLELQPSIQEEQKIVNKVFVQLSKKLGIDYIITTDGHYLRKEDRKVHEAFLNSQDGDREVGDFYGTTYIMSEEEIHEYLDDSLGYEAVQKGIDNTMKIYEQCEEYDLRKSLDIPYIPDNIDEPKEDLYKKYKKEIPLLEYFYNSSHDSDRHLLRQILEVLENKPEELQNKEIYNTIQICLDSIKKASEKQHVQWSAYLLQTSELIKVCWESGSLVGCSRGSGLGFILLYLLNITQVNPLKEDVATYHWRLELIAS